MNNTELQDDTFYAPINKKSGPHNRASTYCASHIQAAVSSWGQLLRTPIATLMTFIVIAIALALPSALFVLLENAKQVSQGWDDSSQISLYLKMSTAPNQIQPLLNQLQKNPSIAAVKYISPAQGLVEFQQQTDFQNALAALAQNPLPAVVLVKPAATLASPAAIKELLQQLKSIPQVDMAKLDLRWIKRLYAIIALSKRLAYVLGGLLGLGVLFIIGNAIHLNLQRYRREIEVFKLIGATDSFIRRPFLYTGMLYGLIGSLIAWLLVSSLLWSMEAPAQQIAALYGSHFQLENLTFSAGLILILGGIFLGLAGAWLAVGKHLRG